MDHLPYRCEFGYMCQQHVDFATFDEALLFYRGYAAAKKLTDHALRQSSIRPFDDGPRIVNTDNIDQADDAKPWAYAGLTEAEWDEVQGVE